jgi:macrolide-specific efflux system membrane fusion protein
LVQIDRGEALLKVQQAKAELDIANRQTGDVFDLQTAQEEHRIASKDLERANQSNTTFERSISEAEMDRYRFRVQKAAIDIERFKFALEVAKLTRDLRATEVELAEKSLERHEVRAPIDGMVVDIKRRRGEWVKPGDLLLRILRLDRLCAEGYVRADAARDRLAGTPVYFEVAVPGKAPTRYLGKIVFVSPEINPVDGKVLIRAEIDNQQLQLKPGVTGSLLITPP